MTNESQFPGVPDHLRPPKRQPAPPQLSRGELEYLDAIIELVERTVEGELASERSQITARILAETGLLQGRADTLRDAITNVAERCDIQIDRLRDEIARVAEPSPVLAYNSARDRDAPRGTRRSWAGGLWEVVAAAGAGGADPGPGSHGWSCVVDGLANVAVEVDDSNDATLVFTMSSGVAVKSALDLHVPRHVGVWMPDRPYFVNNICVHDGGSWIARRRASVNERPGRSTAWTLVAGRGKSGPPLSAAQRAEFEARVIAEVRRAPRLAAGIAEELVRDAGDDAAGRLRSSSTTSVAGALTEIRGWWQKWAGQVVRAHVGEEADIDVAVAEAFNAEAPHLRGDVERLHRRLVAPRFVEARPEAFAREAWAAAVERLLPRLHALAVDEEVTRRLRAAFGPQPPARIEDLRGNA